MKYYSTPQLQGDNTTRQQVGDGSLKVDAIKSRCGDFPGGTVVKNPPANVGDAGLIPGPGRSHMPRSN